MKVGRSGSKWFFNHALHRYSGPGYKARARIMGALYSGKETRGPVGSNGKGRERREAEAESCCAGPESGENQTRVNGGRAPGRPFNRKRMEMRKKEKNN